LTAPVQISRSAGLRRVGLFCLYLLGAMLVSAAFTVTLADVLQGAESGLGGWLMEKGPAKVYRRVLLLLSVPALLVLVRSLGWRGVGDSGWRADGGKGIDPRWRGDFLRGTGLGLVSILCLVGVSFAAGARAADPNHSLLHEPHYVIGFAAAALFIGIFEETLARGVLYRVGARIWGAWPAALGISLIFAYLHYLKPDGAAFESGSWLARVMGVTGSALTAFRQVDDVGWRILNTTLMSVFLCLLVRRTGTIWLAAGTHAAWVWVMKVNGKFSDIVREPPLPGWVPTRPAAIDSPVTAVILALMVACLVALKPRPAPASRPDDMAGTGTGEPDRR
jgi:membrane protease YdiL (CAAX protease family)